MAVSREYVAADRDLDPIRDRADFRAALLDRGFPRDPFAPRSPLDNPERSSLAAAPPARRPLPRAYVGFGFTTVATASPEGIRILRIMPGGPAEADGRLRPGDVILGVNGGPGSDELFAGKDIEAISGQLRGPAGSTVRLIVRPGNTNRRRSTSSPAGPSRPRLVRRDHTAGPGHWWVFRRPPTLDRPGTVPHGVASLSWPPRTSVEPSISRPTTRWSASSGPSWSRIPETSALQRARVRLLERFGPAQNQEDASRTALA